MSVAKRKKKSRQQFELAGAAAFSFAALIIVIFLTTSFARYFVGNGQYAAVLAAVLVDLANGDRASNSVSTLKINPVLVAAAQAKADDMAAKSYFAHVSPEGINPWHWFKQAGYEFSYAGENLAVDFSDSSDVNSAWMNSPTHRENLLDPHFTEIGIAIAEGTYEGHPTTFVVQEFGSPAVASAKEGAPLIVGDVPQNPTQPAIATTQADPVRTTVLGANAQGAQVHAAPPAPHYASWWGQVVGSPRESLQYAYYVLALLLAVIFAFTTGLELRSHHRGKALAAGMLFVLMCGLLATQSSFVLTQPMLTPTATTASAAQAL